MEHAQNRFMKALPQRHRFQDDLILNPFTTGNPFLGTKLLGFSIGRGSGALKGDKSPARRVRMGCVFNDHGTHDNKKQPSL